VLFRSGVLFVTLPAKGAVLALPDTNGDGQADRMVVVAQGLANPSGLAFFRDQLYVAETHEIVRFRYAAGQLNLASDPEVVVRGLPVGNGFNNHALSFGPDGRLYVAVGASCNACKESDYRRATILRYDVDSGHEEVYAQGLRDVEGLAWWPQGERLLATNSSRRGMGDNLPPDTLEEVTQGANFGWPFCHSGDVTDPQLGWPNACDGVPRPLWELPAHTTPGGLCFYTGAQFPRDYFGDVFVAQRGSWERSVPVGYQIARLKVQDGKIVSSETFASGWLVFDQAWGRPVNLLQSPDGSLLVADDRAGAVYRIYYAGG
jgi:glucose/arabinose dehydrogenase